MTPDELPADMEGRLIADAEDMAVQDAGILGISRRSRRLNDMADDLRALLKAYQERGRALARIAITTLRDDGGALHRLGQVAAAARAALNQKGIDAILAALRSTDTGWRDIATAPRDGTAVVGWGFLNSRNDNGPLRSAVMVAHVMRYRNYASGGGDWVSACLSNVISQHPTHWMPLPPAPTDTGANHD